ncbi:hypothetical protein HBN50_04415 [Halobacteriovorax sp. GB3]|uniref:hypothetical protein n=1 Tax=Halobacteriovorax sp. GB3 TaxID=2719615 RepID=UPI00235E4C90|nr:hypothetical protein [Halobacteriovorax sp. GB3]MDD0852326.1 hypothetical protein [Halobacteriovorax sp. GB3]
MKTRKNGNPMKKLVHSLVCYSTSMGLILPSVYIPNALAQSRPNDTFSQVAGVVGQASQYLGNQIINLRQQGMQQYLSANQMSSLKAPQPVPAKYFNDPNFQFCYVAPAKSNYPEGACLETPTNDADAAQANMFRQLSVAYEGYFDQLMSKAQNTTYTKGLQCLDEGKKKLEARFQDKLNSLQALADQIKKDMQLFKEQNKAIKSQMQDLNSELTGKGSGSQSLAEKQRDFSKYFSNECRNIIGPEKLAPGAKNGGLLGVKNSMAQNNQQAVNFQTNKGAYTKRANDAINDIIEQVNKYGISSLSSTFPVKKSNPFAAKMTEAVMKNYSEISTVYKQAQDSIPGDYKLPAMDKHFSVNIENFEKEVVKNLKNDYIQDCVTGDVGLSLDQVLSSLTYTGSGTGSGTINTFKVRIENILNNDSISMDDKIEQLKAFESDNNGKVVMKYKGTDGNTRAPLPYEYFMQAKDACEQRYTADKSSGNLESHSEKTERAKGYLKDLVRLQKNFVSEVSTNITEDLLTCKDRPVETGTCDPNGEIFNPAGDSFCLANATTCSNQVQACYAGAEKVVAQKTKELEVLASKYNANLSALVVMQEAKLAQIKNEVIADMDYLKNYFGGAAYELPKDFFINMPEIDDNNELGVKLLGNGSLEFMDKLPSLIENQIKKMVSDQSKAALANVDQYINDQEASLVNERNKWVGLKDSCTSNITTYNTNENTRNAKNFAQQMENRGLAQNFCNSTRALAKQSPNALCNGNGLKQMSNDMTKILNAGLNGEMNSINGQMVAICEGFGKEAEESSDTKLPALVNICLKKKNNWSKVKENLINSSLSKLPLDIEDKTLAGIEKYLSGESDELPSLEDENLAESLEDLRTSLNGFKMKSTSSSISNWFSEKINSYDNDDNKDKKEALTYLKDNLEGISQDENPCAEINNKAILKAIDLCSGKDSKSSIMDCYEDKYDEEKGNIRSAELRQMNEQFDTSINEDLQVQLSALGERANQIGCFAGNDQSRGAPTMEDIANSLSNLAGAPTAEGR